MQYQHETALVAFNTADHPVLLDNLHTGLVHGRTLHGVFPIDGVPQDVVVGSGGQINFVLPPHAGLVWKATRRSSTSEPTARLRLAPLPRDRVTTDLHVQGDAQGTQEVQLVVDGDLGNALRTPVDAKGHWEARIDTSAMVDAAVAHRVVAWSGEHHAASEARVFHVSRPWRVLVDAEDPHGDDHGPVGRYTYPTDAGWRDVRPLDIEHVRILGAGGSLRIELTMHAVEDAWSPPNGFDHAAFVLYLQVPGLGDGASVMPFQNADVPAGMRWNLRLRVDGFFNALFTARNASATNEGAPVSPTATVAVDKARRLVTFTLPASALGKPATLSGVKLYATTWDMGEGPRPLQAVAGPMAFGGGDGMRDPLVMDDTAVIDLP
jgi:hypothetical protein